MLLSFGTPQNIDPYDDSNQGKHEKREILLHSAEDDVASDRSVDV